MSSSMGKEDAGWQWIYEYHFQHGSRYGACCSIQAMVIIAIGA